MTHFKLASGQAMDWLAWWVWILCALYLTIDTINFDRLDHWDLRNRSHRSAKAPSLAGTEFGWCCLNRVAQGCLSFKRGSEIASWVMGKIFLFYMQWDIAFTPKREAASSMRLFSAFWWKHWPPMKALQLLKQMGALGILLGLQGLSISTWTC